MKKASTSTKTASVRYPWQKWFSRSRFRLVQGYHFGCQLHSMATQIRNAASRLGVSVSVKFNEGDGVLLVTVNSRG